jgi:hypothetical protein
LADLINIDFYNLYKVLQMSTNLYRFLKMFLQISIDFYRFLQMSPIRTPRGTKDLARGRPNGGTTMCNQPAVGQPGAQPFATRCLVNLGGYSFYSFLQISTLYKFLFFFTLTCRFVHRTILHRFWVPLLPDVDRPCIHIMPGCRVASLSSQTCRNL